MTETLNQWDTTLFWWVNSHHSAVGDWVLWVASQAWSWAIVILAVMLLLLPRIGWRRWWLLLLGVGLCFLLSDRISVMVFKDVVQRLRPCHALEEVRMFQTSCGGAYGFISSHAANCCSVAMFLGLIAAGFPRQRSNGQSGLRWVLPVVLAAWALVVCYSRPYLGKHYPGDVLCGAVVGVALGALVYFLYCKSANAVDNSSQKHQP